MKKILIIEDDAEIAMLEKDYLEINGFETEVIANGKQALTALIGGGYDLVLLDLMLPGQDGYHMQATRDKIDILSYGNGFAQSPPIRSAGFLGPMITLSNLSTLPSWWRGSSPI